MFKNMSLFLITLLVSTWALAANPFNSKTVIKLSEHKGMSCSTLMTDILAPAMDKDLTTTFVVADRETLRAEQAKFDPSVFNKLMKDFKDGEAGFDQLIEALQGTEATPDNFRAAIREQLQKLKLLKDPKEIGLAAAKLSPFIGIASGGGVAVVYNNNAACCHFDYKTGADPAKDPKSGRSFIYSKSRNILDPSDVYLMKSVKAYMDKTEDLTPFFTAFFNLILRNDSSGFAKLGDEGQTLLADISGVYQAEQRRHWMSYLKEGPSEQPVVSNPKASHPWEIDLALTVMVSAYGTKSGYVMFKGGQLVEGVPADYFGVSSIAGNGSGLGLTRRFRNALQNRLTQAMRANHPEVTDVIDGIISTGPKDDIYESFMKYILKPENQNVVVDNGPALVKAMTQFIILSRTDSDVMTEHIQPGTIKK